MIVWNIVTKSKLNGNDTDESMRFNVIFSSWVQSNRRSNLSLDNTSFLGVMQHFLFLCIEHIKRAWICSIFYIKLTDPECSLISLNSTVTAHSTLHLLVAHFATFIVEHCCINNFGFNDWEAFCQIFESLSHLFDSSFRVNLRIRRVQLLSMILLDLDNLVDKAPLWEHCAH